MNGYNTDYKRFKLISKIYIFLIKTKVNKKIFLLRGVFIVDTTITKRRIQQNNIPFVL